MQKVKLGWCQSLSLKLPKEHRKLSSKDQDRFTAAHQTGKNSERALGKCEEYQKKLSKQTTNKQTKQQELKHLFDRRKNQVYENK